MGRRGPPKKPSTLKKLQGNPGKRKLPKDEPAPDVCLPKCPAHLDPEAKKEWKRVAPQLQKLGLISDIDAVALAAYCQLFSRWVAAEKDIQSNGITVNGSTGTVIQNPAVRTAASSLDLMKKFLTEFGMTPSSRAGLSINPEEEEDPFAKLKKRAKQPSNN